MSGNLEILGLLRFRPEPGSFCLDLRFGFCWNSLDFLVRIGPFQWVTGLVRPARKYCALLPTTAHIKYDKNATATIVLMTRIVPGIPIFSKKVVGRNVIGRKCHRRRLPANIAAGNSRRADPRSRDDLIALAGVVRVSRRERDGHARGGPASHGERHKKNQKASHRRLRIRRRLTFNEIRQPLFR